MDSAVRPAPTRALGEQSSTPYLDALSQFAQLRRSGFHVPGHNQGKGAHPRLVGAFSAGTLQLDLCSGLADLDGKPGSALDRAQRLAAAVYGADHTRFLTNGSTAGNHILVASVCGPGDLIVTSRNTHKSIIAALILSGARPIYLPVEVDPATRLAHGVAPASVAAVLDEYPQAKAVLIVSPTYYGVCSDLAGIAEACHRRRVPLLVDEAWGPHFPFSADLPEHALALGADGVVTGTHKLLSALTQAAMLHVRGPLLDPRRVEVVADMFASTSPSCLLYASLDVARMQMATEGPRLLARAAGLASHAREVLAAQPFLRCLDEGLIGRYAVHAMDPTRLCVDVTGAGYTGYQAERVLGTRHHVDVEMADFAHVLFNITIAHDAGDVGQLIAALIALAAQPHPQRAQRRDLLEHAPFDWPEQVLTPAEAFSARQCVVPLHRSADRICAELIASYPPGIPAVVPGERITPALVDYLTAQLAHGARMVGPRDPCLLTLTVVDT